MDIALPLPFEPGDFFVNRATELAALAETLTNPGSVVCVVGVGGIGKTTLLRKFASSNADMFPGGIEFFSGSSVSSLDEVRQLRTEYEGARLVILDDYDLVAESDSAELVAKLRMQPQTSIAILSRHRIDSALPCDKVIRLSGLSMADMFEARLRLVPDPPDPKEFRDFVDGNPLFYALHGNPRRALRLAGEILPEGLPEEAQTESSAEARNVRGIDYVSLLLAVALFLFSMMSSARSEDRIRSDVRDLRAAVEAALDEESAPPAANPHVVTEFLRAREEPLVSDDNVLTTLVPGQHVGLLAVDEGWARVQYTLDGSMVEGWVCAKYIESAE